MNRSLQGILTLCAVIFTMRRISVSAHIALCPIKWTVIYGSYVICDGIVWENTNVVHFSCDMGRYSTRPMNKAHTLFIGRVLYFPISHSNEHRFHIVRNNRLCVRCESVIIAVRKAIPQKPGSRTIDCAMNFLRRRLIFYIIL